MFKVVPDYEFAKVNKEGIVISSHTGSRMKPRMDRDGYIIFSVWCPVEKKNKRLSQHRALAKAFIPNPENKPEVNHIDSNRSNNELSNLEWCTEKENHTHGLLYGDMLTGRLGEENPNSNLKEYQVHEVCDLLSKGVSMSEISRITHIKESSVFDIKSKSKWVEISGKYNIPEVKKNLTEDVVHDICKELLNGVSDKEINHKYSLKRGVLYHLKKRNTFKHISSQYNWDKVQRSV